MRQNRTFSISIIAFFATCLFLSSCSAPNVDEGEVSFSSSSISCSLSGTYTKYTYDDGTVAWEPSEPSSATVSASGTAEGTGYAAAELVSGSINGTAILSSKRYKTVGEYGYRGFSVKPFAESGTASPSTSHTVSSLPLGPGTYAWSAFGKFYTQGVRYSGTSWQRKPESYTSAGSSGSWTIVHESVYC